MHRNPLSSRYAESIFPYIEQGRPLGDFLEAVMSNDLFGAFGKADAQSREDLFLLVAWLYNFAPAGCHGSREKYKAWVQEGGLNGNKG